MHQAEESDLVPFFELSKELELTLKTIIRGFCLLFDSFISTNRK